MDVTPGTGALGTYVRVRDGCVASSANYTDARVTVYSSGYGTSREKVAFELVLGYDPDLDCIRRIFMLGVLEYAELERLWPVVLDGHVIDGEPVRKVLKSATDSGGHWYGY